MGKHFTEYIDLTSLRTSGWSMNWIWRSVLIPACTFTKTQMHMGTVNCMPPGHGTWSIPSMWQNMRSKAGLPQQTQTRQDYWIWLYRHPEFGEAVQNQWQKVFVPALNQILAEQKTEDPHDLYKAQRIFKPCIARISVAICLLLSEGWHIIWRDLWWKYRWSPCRDSSYDEKIKIRYKRRAVRIVTEAIMCYT